MQDLQRAVFRCRCHMLAIGMRSDGQHLVPVKRHGKKAGTRLHIPSLDLARPIHTLRSQVAGASDVILALTEEVLPVADAVKGATVPPQAREGREIALGVDRLFHMEASASLHDPDVWIAAMLGPTRPPRNVSASVNSPSSSPSAHARLMARPPGG